MDHFVNNMLPISFVNTYKFNYEVQHSHRSRHSHDFYIERCNTFFASKLPLFNFPKIWNKWSIHISSNDQKSQTRIKEKVKSLMLNKYPETVKCDNPKCKSKHCSMNKGP